MRPRMQAIRDTDNFTISASMEYMHDAYQNPELKEYARQKLSTIQQGNRSSIEYIAEFDKTFYSWKLSLVICPVGRRLAKFVRVLTARLAAYW